MTSFSISFRVAYSCPVKLQRLRVLYFGVLPKMGVGAERAPRDCLNDGFANRLIHEVEHPADGVLSVRRDLLPEGAIPGRPAAGHSAQTV